MRGVECEVGDGEVERKRAGRAVEVLRTQLTALEERVRELERERREEGEKMDREHLKELERQVERFQRGLCRRGGEEGVKIIVSYLYTVFPSGPYSTRSLNETGLYTGPAFIYAHSSCSGFRRVLFCTVYSSKLESDIVALSLG